MRGTTILWVGLGALLAGAGLWLWFFAEWVEEEVDLGYSAEARRNDFLAAERFLESHRVASETVTGMKLLDALPSTDDALLMSAAREALSDRRRDALVEWVEQGGLLMVIAHSTYDPELDGSRDPLLDALGVFLLPPDLSDEAAEGDGAPTDEDVSIGGEDAFVEVTSDEIEEALAQEVVEEADALLAPAVEESEVLRIQDAYEARASPIPDEEAGREASPSEVAAREDASTANVDDLLERFLGGTTCRENDDGLDRVDLGVEGRPAVLELDGVNTLAVYEERFEEAYLSPEKQVLALPVGAGRVIALTSVQPFRNERIACQDHAWFLWFTFEGRPKVWMLHDPEVPSVMDLALEHFPLASWGGLALVVAACLAYSLRFELPVRGLDAPRREHLEHLEASVTFLYRKGGYARLMARLREDLGSRAPLDHDKWGARAGLVPEAAAEALRNDAPRGRRALIERTRSMLRMRRTK